MGNESQPNPEPARAGSEPVQAWRRRVRTALRVLTFAYAAAVIGGLALTAWVGERHWLTGLALFAPPVLWLAPAPVLAVAALLFSRRMLWALGAAAAMVALHFTDVQWHEPRKTAGRAYTILSNNSGERDFDSLIAFAKEVRPDIVALQDSNRPEAWKLARAIGLPHVAFVGEFLLVSRFPITKRAPSVARELSYASSAARFEIDCEGTPLVVWSVHLPTPRHDFLRLRGTRWMSAGVRRDVAAAMKLRVGLAAELAAEIAKDAQPMLVVGDFNAPAQGHVKRIFDARLTDCFTAAGRGTGLTFPGASRTPFEWSGRWLRLDHVFAGPGIVPLAVRTEPRGRAQHMANVAQFAITGAAAK